MHKSTFLIYYLTLTFSLPVIAKPDPAIEANHIRENIYFEKDKENTELLSEEKIKKIELSIDDSLESFTKFKGKKKNFVKKKSSAIKYRSKKIIKKGALLYKNNRYFVSPRAILAFISHDPKNYYSEVLNLFDEETYFIRNIDLISTNRFFDLETKPDHKINYPEKLLTKKYYERLPMSLKFDLQTEIFKEGYLDELADNTSSDSKVPSLAAGLGFSFHLTTNYDFLLNMGLSSFFHTGTWFSGFEKTIYQSFYIGPEIILRLGSIEGLNIYGVCELTRSLYNSISDSQKTIDLFLRNSSYKFGIELKAKNKKSTWYTGAYYRLIESSLGRETSDDVSKPRYRQNSNAYGLYFGRTFDFNW